MKTKLLNLGFFAKLFHKMLAHLERFAIIIFTKWCTFQTDKDMFHIPSLYDEIDPILKQEKIHIAESTFKNMLMESRTQSCDWEKRLKVINLIFEYLDPEKINAAYEGVKLARDKEIRFCVFDHKGTIIFNSGAEQFIKKIDVKMGKNEPEQILVSPTEHLNVQPLLECINYNFTVSAERINKSDWQFTLSSPDYLIAAGPKIEK